MRVAVAALIILLRAFQEAVLVDRGVVVMATVLPHHKHQRPELPILEVAEEVVTAPLLVLRKAAQAS